MSRHAVGARLAELRKSRGETGRSFAELVEWTPSRLSQIERGHLALSFDALPLIASALDLPAHHVAWVLAGGGDEMSRPTLGPRGSGLLADAAVSARDVARQLDELTEGLSIS